MIAASGQCLFRSEAQHEHHSMGGPLPSRSGELTGIGTITGHRYSQGIYPGHIPHTPTTYLLSTTPGPALPPSPSEPSCYRKIGNRKPGAKSSPASPATPRYRKPATPKSRHQRFAPDAFRSGRDAGIGFAIFATLSNKATYWLRSSKNDSGRQNSRR